MSKAGDGRVDFDRSFWKTTCKLKWNFAHPFGGESRASFAEHLEGELEHLAGGSQIPLEKDSTIEAAEEPIELPSGIFRLDIPVPLPEAPPIPYAEVNPIR